MRTLALLCVAAALAISAGAVEAADYRVTLLDAPGNRAFALSINNSGQIVGYSNTSDDTADHAILWTPTETGYTVQDLGTLGGRSGYAQSINNNGQIVGYSNTSSNAMHAFLYDTNAPGSDMQDLAAEEAGLGNYSVAFDINDRGQVAGCIVTIDGGRAFLYDPNATGNKVQIAGTLGGDTSSAMRVNENGQVVGYSTTPDGVPHPLLWNPNAANNNLQQLSESWGMAYGINDSGQIVGYFEISGLPHPFLWDPNATGQKLQLLASSLPEYGIAEIAYGINNKGQVVMSNSGAVLWDPSADSGSGLTILSAGASGYYPAYVSAINERGQIVGAIYNPNIGRYQAVLWDPVVPEPTSILSLVAGIAGIGGFAIRRRK